MQGILFEAGGRWAHFKKPDTNNTPLTHDFLTKTALLGLMGAVLGIERGEMRELFPQWSEDFLYGVQLLRTLKKESWSFTLRGLGGGQAPKPLEFLREPSWKVALTLKSERSRAAFETFAECLQNGRAHFTPVLGLHNCPAELTLLSRGEWRESQGEYSTHGFALRSHTIPLTMKDLEQLRVGFERIPTYQNNDFWNHHDDYDVYREVIYPDNGGTLRMSGEHFICFDNSSWCLL